MGDRISFSSDEAASKIRVLAEMTAAHSKNWQAFEAIVQDLLNQFYEAGKAHAPNKPQSGSG